MTRLVCGVGVNDADYAVHERVFDNGGQKVVWVCPFYTTWRSMLARCYNKKHQERAVAYKGVTVCEEWLIFSNFKSWMEQQDWEGKELDKDIIVFESRVYSPNTCAFVSHATNSFILDRENARGNLPLGVCFKKQTSRYLARCNNPVTVKRDNIGYFDCPYEAHEAWRKRKHEYAQLVAETESDPRVVEALRKRYSYEEWYGDKKEG